MEQQAGNGTPLAMRVRRLWPDRNPLRRAADRAEFAVAALLLVAFLVGVPLTALAAAHWAAASGLRAERAQAGWHQVAAVLLHAPASAGSQSFPVPWPQVPARWASPAGPRTGTVGALPGAKAGSTVEVWTDRSGRLTGAPIAAADVADRVLLAALTAPVALSVLVLVLWAYAGIFLDWRRMAAWDADWAVTGPQWTGRHDQSGRRGNCRGRQRAGRLAPIVTDRLGGVAACVPRQDEQQVRQPVEVAQHLVANQMTARPGPAGRSSSSVITGNALALGRHRETRRLP